MHELESSILDVLDSTISRVARVVVVAENFGIRVDWLDRVIGVICARKEHSVLVQQEEQLSTQNAKLCEEAGRAKQRLGEIRVEMAFRNFCPGPVVNEKICLIADP